MTQVACKNGALLDLLRSVAAAKRCKQTQQIMSVSQSIQE